MINHRWSHNPSRPASSPLRTGASSDRPNRAVASRISFVSPGRSPAAIVRRRGRCAGAVVNPSTHVVLPSSQASYLPSQPRRAPETSFVKPGSERPFYTSVHQVNPRHRALAHPQGEAPPKPVAPSAIPRWASAPHRPSGSGPPDSATTRTSNFRASATMPISGQARPAGPKSGLYQGERGVGGWKPKQPHRGWTITRPKGGMAGGGNALVLGGLAALNRGRTKATRRPRLAPIRNRRQSENLVRKNQSAVRPNRWTRRRGLIRRPGRVRTVKGRWAGGGGSAELGVTGRRRGQVRPRRLRKPGGDRRVIRETRAVQRVEKVPVDSQPDALGRQEGLQPIDQPRAIPRQALGGAANGARLPPPASARAPRPDPLAADIPARTSRRPPRIQPVGLRASRAPIHCNGLDLEVAVPIRVGLRYAAPVSARFVATDHGHVISQAESTFLARHLRVKHAQAASGHAGPAGARSRRYAPI